jgi:hypothetical protein
VSRVNRAMRFSRRAWPFMLMAWERWQKIEPEQRERYLKQARLYAAKGRKAIDQRRPRKR